MKIKNIKWEVNMADLSLDDKVRLATVPGTDINDIVGLPTTVTVPETISRDFAGIGSYLFNEYGFIAADYTVED